MLGDLFEDEDVTTGNWRTGHVTPRTYGSTVPAPRPPTGFAGIENRGATCYLNSLLQTMFMTPELRAGMYGLPARAPEGADTGKAPRPKVNEAKLMNFTSMGFSRTAVVRALEALPHGDDDAVLDWLFSNPVDEGGEERMEEEPAAGGGGAGDTELHIIPTELQRLFAALQCQDTGWVSTESLTEAFGWDSSDTSVQHDVHELNRLLFDILEQSLASTPAKSMIEDLYKGVYVNRMTCLNCNNHRDREEAFMDVSLVVKGLPSVTDSLARVVETELLEGANQYQCDNCGQKSDARSGALFRRLPPMLTFNLSRFEYNWQTDQRSKLTSEHAFPLVLDMTPYLEGRGGGGPGRGSPSMVSYAGSTAHGAAEGGDTASVSMMSVARSNASMDGLEPHPKRQNSGRLSGELSAGSGGSGAVADDGSHLYDLFSVVIHSGSAYSGHYHAYIRDIISPPDGAGTAPAGTSEVADLMGVDTPRAAQGESSPSAGTPPARWYDFNDTSVTPMSEEDLKRVYGGSNECGYMLVYRARSCPVPAAGGVIDVPTKAPPATAAPEPGGLPEALLPPAVLRDYLAAKNADLKRQREVEDEEINKLQVTIHLPTAFVFDPRFVIRPASVFDSDDVSSSSMCNAGVVASGESAGPGVTGGVGEGMTSGQVITVDKRETMEALRARLHGMLSESQRQDMGITGPDVILASPVRVSNHGVKFCKSLQEQLVEYGASTRRGGGDDDSTHSNDAVVGSEDGSVSPDVPTPCDEWTFSAGVVGGDGAQDAGPGPQDADENVVAAAASTLEGLSTAKDQGGLAGAIGSPGDCRSSAPEGVTVTGAGLYNGCSVMCWNGQTINNIPFDPDTDNCLELSVNFVERRGAGKDVQTVTSPVFVSASVTVARLRELLDEEVNGILEDGDVPRGVISLVDRVARQLRVLDDDAKSLHELKVLDGATVNYETKSPEAIAEEEKRAAQEAAAGRGSAVGSECSAGESMEIVVRAECSKAHLGDVPVVRVPVAPGDTLGAFKVAALGALGMQVEVTKDVTRLRRCQAGLQGDGELFASEMATVAESGLVHGESVVLEYGEAPLTSSMRVLCVVPSSPTTNDTSSTDAINHATAEEGGGRTGVVTIEVDRTALVFELKSRAAEAIGESPSNLRLRRNDMWDNPAELYTDEHVSLEAAGIRDQDRVHLERGPAPVKGQISLQIFCFTLAPPGADDAAGPVRSGMPVRVPTTAARDYGGWGLFTLCSVELPKSSSVHELKQMAMATVDPGVWRALVPEGTPMDLEQVRARRLVDMTPGKTLQDGVTLARQQVQDGGKIVLQVGAPPCPPHGIVLLLRARDTALGSWGPAQELILDAGPAPMLEDVYKRVAETVGRAPESIRVAKYAPGFSQWMAMAPQEGSAAQDGKEPARTVRAAPYYINDGDVIGWRPWGAGDEEIDRTWAPLSPSVNIQCAIHREGAASSTGRARSSEVQLKIKF